jgi:tetratricopeptide (TPR) repeat protein
MAAAVLVSVAARSVSAQAPSTAQQWADSAQKAIATANLAGDADAVLAARALIDRALTRFPDDPWLLHYRGFALYREATVRQGRERKEVQQYLEEAERALDKSASQLALPETHALLGSVIGMQIGSNPIRGMTHGPRADGAMDRALELGANNPHVWLLHGIGTMFRPKLFGGGNERAEQYLRRSIALFERDRPAPPAPSWGRDEAWLWLGQVLEEAKRWEEARRAYETALTLAPDNLWVRHELLANLDRRKASRE